MSSGLVFVAIPLGLTALFAVEVWLAHLTNVRRLAIQALYLRIVICFPLVSLIAVFGGAFAAFFEAAEVLVGMVEGYVFVLFLALILSWAWEHGDVYSALLSSKVTNRWFSCGMHACGSYYGSGEAILRSFCWQVYQFAIVRPLIKIIDATTMQVEGSPNALTLILGAINLVSIVIALKALLSLYRALRGAVPDPKRAVEGTEPLNLLKGLKAFRKFFIVKAMLGFLVLNNLVFRNLIADGKMPVPDFLCDAGDALRDCEARYLAFLFSLEVFLLAFLSVFVFRPSDLKEFEEDADISTSKLLWRFLRLGDIVAMTFNSDPKKENPV